MRILLFVIATILFFGCIKQVNLNYRAAGKTLVVEGLLLTDSTPCKVSLSFSGLFNERGAQLKDPITDATVFLFDDMNDSLKLAGDNAGNYTDINLQFKPQVGHNYFIKIYLADGSKYASIPEKIEPAVQNFELDSIGVSDATGIPQLYGADVKINIQDPANETNYYRWISVDYLSRKATGVPCGFGPPCDAYCYQLFNDSAVRILSDKSINGNLIKDQSVLISPYYYYGKLFIEIKQLSLTREAFQFWQLYAQQTTRTGTIEDPLPSALNGNIYNMEDSTKLALGYFEASDVYSKRYTLAPQFIYAYYTLANVAQYIYPYQGKCWDVYPNAMEDGPKDWQNIPQIIYNVYQ